MAPTHVTRTRSAEPVAPRSAARAPVCEPPCAQEGETGSPVAAVRGSPGRTRRPTKSKFYVMVTPTCY